MAKQSGGITEAFAKRIAAAVQYVEMLRAKRPEPTKPTQPIGQGFVEITWAKLDADLAVNSSAAATILYQAANGTWTAGTADADDITVYAKYLTGSISLIPSGKKLASGGVVAVARNRQSGLYNLLQSTACPVAA